MLSLRHNWQLFKSFWMQHQPRSEKGGYLGKRNNQGNMLSHASSSEIQFSTGTFQVMLLKAAFFEQLPTWFSKKG